MEGRDESNDWIFDYVLTVLNSPIWEASVMNFIDEHCVIFDTEEENKFEHWDVYVEYRERVEALLQQLLSEVSISAEEFISACEQSRSGRDVNKEAFEQLLALDDFVSFKTIMVRRNIELELEAIKNWQGSSGEVDSSEEKEAADKLRKEAVQGASTAIEANAREEEALKQAEKASKKESSEREVDFHAAKRTEELELAQAVSASLLEMELMHRQEQMEQMELEKVIAISLALEEERLRLAREEAEKQKSSGGENNLEQPAKATSGTERSRSHESKNVERAERKSATIEDSRRQAGKGIEASVGEKSTTLPVMTERKQDLTEGRTQVKKHEEKPHPKRPVEIVQEVKQQMESLAPKARVSQAEMERMEQRVERKKREAEDTLRLNEQRLQEHRTKEEDLQRKARISKEEMERRAMYLRSQRDKIVAQKKAERDAEARNYEAENREQPVPHAAEVPVPLPKFKMGAKPDADSSNQESKQAAEQRNAMRIALARKMKQELLANEEKRLAQTHMNQIQALDEKLREVEHLRRENRQKEEELSRLVQIQQEARGRVLTGGDYK